ncbi:extracellular serine/threonine protein kinase four-jointed [Diorhabda carinulata]|uniref:extracellular serine/threonine protein kinase four-jointed n=1 Tax=Diorhabda carinulata TaxID=1163345 RepID=UPI0025A0D357|nr:extracellular serine/threonine protein kinase four-jointed [Diorhabda carinulata]
MGYFRAKTSSQWDSDIKPLQFKPNHTSVYKNFCLLSVTFAFSVGFTLGILIPLVYIKSHNANETESILNETLVTNTSVIKTIFLNNSYGYMNYTRNKFPSVSFVENIKDPSSDEQLIEDGIYWGRTIERALPEGYHDKKHVIWEDYVKNAIAVKMENGCGRMQNRLITFQDGTKGCVRYRQNTDQIQGELFSFYLAKILNIPNLAPSTIRVINLNDPLWRNLRNEIASAQWNSNRPIVLTQFISNLNSANIPNVFKPVERHLNKFDVINMTKNEVLDSGDLIKTLIELAQWSDLIIFDYLTANLDRIVNNLYNYQWNANIMDAPAHNLARKANSDLLLFLDNESGLLHGYRLLKKYEVYHSILLDNLCLFRRQTVDKIKELKSKGNIGHMLRGMFEKLNSETVKDILPTIPDKSVKILNERIEKVSNQISKCESNFSNS